MKKFLIISFICLFVSQYAFAYNPPWKTFTSDDTIQAGDAWWGVDIYDTPPDHTAVTMTGGTIVDGGIAIHDAATFNFSGGSPGWITAYDQSTANIIGGLSAACVTNNATVNISNNANVSMASAGLSGIFNVYGGTIGQLAGDDLAIVNVYDGDIGGISGIGAYGSSIFNFRGGSITFIHADYGEIAPVLLSTINVFGFDLAKTDTGGTYGHGQVTGFWQNGSPFAIDFRDSHTNLNVNLIPVPEPATLLLLGLGCLFIRKRK